jgi:hypothetical protein
MKLPIQAKPIVRRVSSVKVSTVNGIKSSGIICVDYGSYKICEIY